MTARRLARRPRILVIGEVLDRPEPLLPAVTRLLEGLEAREAGLLERVRAGWSREQDPRVLAAMATVVEGMGDAADGPDLLRLLDHEEPLVVTHALRALDRLGIPVGRRKLEDLVRSNSSRIGGAALESIGRQDPAWALRFARAHYPGAGLTARRGLLHALRGHGKDPAGRALFLDLLATESAPPLLKPLGEALMEALPGLDPDEAKEVLLRLRRLPPLASPDRKALVETLTLRIVNQCGWSFEEVEAWSLPAPQPPGETPPLEGPAPDVPGGDGDLPVSFGALWGNASPDEFRLRTQRIQRSVALRRDETPFPRRMALGAGIVLVGAALVTLTSRRPAMVLPPPVELSRKSPAGPGAGARYQRQGFYASGGGTETPQAGERTFTVGEVLDLEGTVLSFDGQQVVLKGSGAYFVARGELPTGLAVGGTLEVRGTILSRGTDGMILVRVD